MDYGELKKYRDLKKVPRPSPGSGSMFIHVLPSGEEILTMIVDDGRTFQVMSAEDTAAQLSKKR